jgi:hypothetical protein
MKTLRYRYKEKNHSFFIKIFDKIQKLIFKCLLTRYTVAPLEIMVVLILTGFIGFLNPRVFMELFHKDSFIFNPIKEIEDYDDLHQRMDFVAYCEANKLEPIL